MKNAPDDPHSRDEVITSVQRRRHWSAAELLADPSRVRDMLGFSPLHSDLGTIVRFAWAWHYIRSGLIFPWG